MVTIATSPEGPYVCHPLEVDRSFMEQFNGFELWTYGVEGPWSGFSKADEGGQARAVVEMKKGWRVALAKSPKRTQHRGMETND